MSLSPLSFRNKLTSVGIEITVEDSSRLFRDILNLNPLIPSVDATMNEAHLEAFSVKLYGELSNTLERLRVGRPNPPGAWSYEELGLYLKVYKALKGDDPKKFNVITYFETQYGYLKSILKSSLGGAAYPVAARLHQGAAIVLRADSFDRDAFVDQVIGRVLTLGIKTDYTPVETESLVRSVHELVDTRGIVDPRILGDRINKLKLELAVGTQASMADILEKFVLFGLLAQKYNDSDEKEAYFVSHLKLRLEALEWGINEFVAVTYRSEGLYPRTFGDWAREVGLASDELTEGASEILDRAAEVIEGLESPPYHRARWHLMNHLCQTARRLEEEIHREWGTDKFIPQSDLIAVVALDTWLRGTKESLWRIAWQLIAAASPRTPPLPKPEPSLGAFQDLLHAMDVPPPIVAQLYEDPVNLDFILESRLQLFDPPKYEVSRALQAQLDEMSASHQAAPHKAALIKPRHLRRLKLRAFETELESPGQGMGLIQGYNQYLTRLGGGVMPGDAMVPASLFGLH